MFADEVQTILSAPGIAATADRDPIATVEMVSSVQPRKKNSDVRAALVIRGMSEQGALVRPEIKIVEGRWFKPGLNELVVGRSAQAQFQGLTVGDKVRLRRGEWTVVGAFESGNGLQGSVLTDTKTFGLGANEGSMIAQLRVTPAVMAIGLVWACAVGFLGGLFPAIRAARMPVASALKTE